MAGPRSRTPQRVNVGPAPKAANVDRRRHALARGAPAVAGGPATARAGPFPGVALAGRVALVAALSFGACSDGTGPEPVGALAGRAFVVNSIGETLSIVGRSEDTGDLVARNDVVELGPSSFAVTIAVGEGAVVVPAGGTSRLLVFDEETLARRCAAELPLASSPFGVTVAGGDAYVSLLLAGAVARVDLATCAVEAVAPVGPAPADIEVLGGRAMVVVGNIDLTQGLNPPPRLGPSYVAFLDALTLALEDTVGTGGFNAQFAALDRDGELIVVNTGDFNQGNSTVSVIDPAGRRLLAGPLPIGDSAGELSVAPDGRAYVTSFTEGLYVFDTRSNEVLRSTTNPLSADSAGVRRGSSGVAVDRRGNVLSVYFGNAATPGQVFLFDRTEALVDSVAVGVGPFAVALEEEAQPE